MTVPVPAGADTPRYLSKTLASWVAMLGGALGLHRFYLYGFGDRWGWLHPVPTLLGLYGLLRMRALGVDDRLAWVLIPLLGLMISAGMLTAIIYGLMPDEKWNARHNPAGPEHHTGWLTVIGVVLSLLIGGGVLMATIAFTAEHYFVWQLAG